MQQPGKVCHEPGEQRNAGLDPKSRDSIPGIPGIAEALEGADVLASAGCGGGCP